MVFREAGETFARYFKRFASIEVHRQAKLVPKLLRERALSEPLSDARYQLPALLFAQRAVFQAAAHY